LLARVLYFVGEGNAQLVLSGAVGGGAGIRMVVNPEDVSTEDMVDLKRHDTVRAGPLLFGPGLGGMYHLARWGAIVIEARGLVGGFSRVGMVGELSGGVQLAF
jgi:hypothetical protein